VNHIHRLQSDVQNANNELATVRQQVADLRAYLRSDKFIVVSELQGYVSTQDVLNRLQGI